MPLSEYDTKEALRAATDCLVASELPGSAAAREGIADTIPLVMMIRSSSDHRPQQSYDSHRYGVADSQSSELIGLANEHRARTDHEPARLPPF